MSMKTLLTGASGRMATVLRPAAGEREKRLLDVKYRIFLESIEIQRRWRREIDAVAD